MANCKPRKRKRLEDLNTDEFLQFGLDSDASEEEDNVKRQPPIVRKAAKEGETTSSHKSQLDGLKEKDPEFYKFLLENDEKLLEFDESDDEGLESDEQHEVNSDKETSGEEDNSSVKEEDCITPVNRGVTNRTDVTAAMIRGWTSTLEDKPSIKLLRQVMAAFHCAVVDISMQNEKESGKKDALTYRVGSKEFNGLTRLCIQHSHHVLTGLLKLEKRKKAKGRQALPSSAQNWSSVKSSVRVYLYDVLQLLRQLVDPGMLVVVLKHAKQMSSFYACFPRIAKMYLKRLVRMWSSEEDLVRMVALLCIRQVTLLMPNLYEFVIKLMYISYVKSCKFVNNKSLPVVVFMRNSLVEIFALDVNAAYQIGFVYIRQLAIHLRNALTTKKDAHQAVYNWQYISCIQLWCHVISSIHSDSLHPLIYPVVQITLGVVRLIPSAKYYPLRFHCIRSLIGLAKATGTYIPISPYLTEVLETAEFTKMPKPSTSKPSDFSAALKVPKSELHSKAFLESVINAIYDLLLEHFVTMSCSIGYPELVFPTSLRLKKFAKAAKVQKFSKQIKQLNDKLQETAVEMAARRSTVDFSPKDLDQVDKWESQMQTDGNKLMKFYESWKKTQDAIALQKLNRQDDNSDDDDHEKEEDEEAEEDAITDKQEEKKKKKKVRSSKKPKDKKILPAVSQQEGHNATSMDDSVHDLVFSDSD